MFPNWLRWKGWSLPSKASYAGFWVGVAGFVVGVIGIVLAAYFYYNPKAGPPSLTDEYVRRTNPVQIQFVDARLQHWLGDAEKALTLHLRNRSSVPIDNVKVSLELHGEPLPQFKSEAFREVDLSTISVPPDRVLELPLAPLSVLEAALRGRVCGAGLEPPDLGKAFPASCKHFPSVISNMLIGRLTYQTVFKEAKTDSQKIWVYSCSGC